MERGGFRSPWFGMPSLPPLRDKDDDDDDDDVDASSSKRKYDRGTAGSTSTITIWKILVTRAHFHVLLLLLQRRRRRTTMTSVGDHRTARIGPCVVARLFRDENPINAMRFRDSAATFCLPGIRPRLSSTFGRARRT